MRLFSTLAAAAAVLLAQFPCSDAVPVNISNIHYRYNTSGIVMDAHDGSYNRWTPDGPWYYYAMGYGKCTPGEAVAAAAICLLAWGAQSPTARPDPRKEQEHERVRCISGSGVCTV